MALSHSRKLFSSPLNHLFACSTLSKLFTNHPTQVILSNCTRNISNFQAFQVTNNQRWKLLGIFGLTTSALYLGYFQMKKASVFVFRVSAATPIEPAKINIDDDTSSVPLRRSEKFNFIADIVEKTAPSVVYLEIMGRHPFTGHIIPVSNGSGFIVREDGLILTNAHVVANRASVIVKLHDGRIFNGLVEDIDSVSDLATVRIQCKNLPVMKLGSSTKVRPGEWVVAMGSPLSLSNTITSGVISTVHRESKELGIRHKNMEYIQTDASINVGNSGGPLVNLDGEAIGINTMKVTEGISFAIPADYAEEFLKQNDENKKASWSWFGKGTSTPSTPKRRYIGITMLALSPTLILELQQRQTDFSEEISHGVLIWKIVVGSPAYKGGLQPGDVITHINGKAIMSAGDVNNALDSKHDLNMNILRKRNRLTLTVVPEQ
uniref:Serine protease HTRA2, mitochondrial n=1 Tax=Strigamia maritima TaxID=126957 RepID=T1IQJ2_STRMM